MTNRELKKALLLKLGVTRQAISNQVQTLKTKHPMTTADATYLIAHRNGIKLDRYLSTEEIDRVRGLLGDTTGHSVTETKHGGRIPRKTAAQQRTIVIGKEFKGTDPILAITVLNEAKEMAAIYPLLYVLENSVREAIKRVMQRNHGESWWDKYAPQGLKDTVEKRMVAEKANAWHQRRGAHSICYLDLDQLKAIVKKNENDFVPTLFGSVEWFTHFIDELYPSRCVLAHMNPLDRDNVQAVRLSFNRWQKLINSKLSAL